MLMSIFKEYGIESKIWIMITDSAKSMIKLESDLNKKSYSEGK